MKFGQVVLAEALGGILAHSAHAGERVLRKGRVLSAEDIALLASEGIESITIARPEASDVGEDEAAARIAAACGGGGVRVGAAFTGRANLYAATGGIARIDAAGVRNLNEIDESITLATLPAFARVEARQMLATVKIIPFAAPRSGVEAAERLASGRRLVEVIPFLERKAALISTRLPGTRAQILDKSEAIIGARLAILGSRLVFKRRVPHEEASVAAAIAEARTDGADPILVFGASAITDRRDVIAEAIVRAGGEIVRFGMPVDPGNLLLLARIGKATVIGLPGCARSPKRNGFDFVLERVLTGESLGSADISDMALGGLLAEIPSRPQPRDADDQHKLREPDIAALVLAAGLSSRMGRNKLIAVLDDKPIVRHVTEAAVASHASRTIVVAGNESPSVRTALDGLPVSFADNGDFRSGLSSSLKVGIRTVPAGCDAALVLLGDMPAVDARLIDRMIAAFNPEEGRAICVATHHGKRGNPVLWSRRFFPEILALEGDVGAKHLIAANEDMVCEIEAGSDAPLIDIDTPEALEAYASRAR